MILRARHFSGSFVFHDTLTLYPLSKAQRTFKKHKDDYSNAFPTCKVGIFQPPRLSTLPRPKCYYISTMQTGLSDGFNGQRSICTISPATRGCASPPTSRSRGPRGPFGPVGVPCRLEAPPRWQSTNRRHCPSCANLPLSRCPTNRSTERRVLVRRDAVG